MNLIVCLDDKNGLAFNHRRQSRDRVLNTTVLELTKNSQLWMNSYTASMFSELGGSHIMVTDDGFNSIPDGDYCFLENSSAQALASNIEKIFVFRWNRTYPCDIQFDIDLTQWHLAETSEFAGSSHEKITLEVYEH